MALTTDNFMHCGINFGTSTRNSLSRDTPAKASFPKANVSVETGSRWMRRGVRLVQPLSGGVLKLRTQERSSVALRSYVEPTYASCAQMLPSDVSR